MTVKTAVSVKTLRYGRLETVGVDEQHLLAFPDGLPGFENYTAFALLDDAALRPFRRLQAIDEPALGFLVLEPSAFTRDYGFELSDEDAARVGLDGITDPLVLCILVVRNDVRAMTANLRAPLVINQQRRLGKQVILSDAYPLRHPVFGPATPAAAEPEPCSS